MPFRLKSRLVDVGKKQVDLMVELKKRGFKVNPTELSQAINDRVQQPKLDRILSAANEIVSEWEQKRS